MRRRRLVCARRQAMALVIVLAALVLISLLAVSFFLSVSRELSASKSYASGVSARIYADAAVNVVMGQLRAATTADDPTVTWTSQPGLLRQYDNQGRQQKVFKLYSSDRMVDGGSFSLLSGGKPSDVPAWLPADAATNLPWNRDPGLYTDLNAPVVVNRKPSYPILNPGGLKAGTKIEGFDVSADYGIPDTDDLDGDGDTTEIGQIPMPVKWLYVLADGRLATAQRDPSQAKTVTLSTADGNAVTAANPPVARIAFWTDDDTCRLNINTASDGSFWMLPVTSGADDSLATGQVNIHEYQRYPGHPATTSLAPVFDSLTTNATDLSNFLYAVTPRISGRGSQTGSRYIGYGMPINLDHDRLYASVDELLFLPDFDSSKDQRYALNSDNVASLKSSELDWNFTSSSKYSMTGSKYAFSSSFGIDPDRLELMRFFLTTDSRAPEVNLFGKPRVSLWPVDTRNGYQSAYDKLLAFCSTIDHEAYYFQRQNPDSPKEDYDAIARNQELFAYLNYLTGQPIPGEGGSFSDKYTVGDREQLFTNIFDWIRCVNLAYRDKSGIVQPYDWQANPAASGSETSMPPGKPGSGQVLPIKIDTFQGVGRFPVLSKAALSIVREEEIDDAASGTSKVRYRVMFVPETYVPMMGYAGYIPNYRLSVSGLQGGFEFFCDQGSSDTSPKTVKPVEMQDGSILVTAPSNFEAFSGRAWGGTQGFNNLFAYSDSGANDTLTARTLGSPDPVSGYPFVSSQIEISVPTGNKSKLRVGLRPANGLTNQRVTVTLKDASDVNTITTNQLDFPAFGPVRGSVLGDSASTLQSDSVLPKLQDRAYQMVEAGKVSQGAHEVEALRYKSMVANIDVVRGLELKHGDLRLLAMQGTSSANLFVPHTNYSDSNELRSQAHSLLRPGGAADAGPDVGLYFKSDGSVNTSAKSNHLTRGFLVANTSAEWYTAGSASCFYPQAPSGWASASAPGDFSTGVGSEGDGPHIMKADEGNSSFGGMNWGQSSRFPYQNQLFPWNDYLSTTFSPNREVSSAVQLGTIPAAAASGSAWRTLLFRPDLAGNHPGSQSPPDYCLLDLFWMPVVDPYPISEPLSTAGKVNMNYQIAPFTYINRSTAMLGALKSVKIPAIPKEHVNYYKSTSYTVDVTKSRYPISYLYGVDSDKTLLFFQDRFSSSDPNMNVFRSPSEICSIPLAPMNNTSSPIATGHSTNAPVQGVIASVNIAGATSAATLKSAIADFWNDNTLTGDNVREAPYNALYPRLTTQSNTYTVYVRVQTLSVNPATGAGRFSDSKDRVTGEYRGSYHIERFIDTSNPDIRDFAIPASYAKTIYPYYQFRIKGAKQFLAE